MATQQILCDLPANPAQDEVEILEALRSAQLTHDNLWLVASPPPDWPNRLVAMDWLEANMQLLRETQIGVLPVRQYRSWEVRAEELAAEDLASFAQVAGIAGAKTGRTPADLVVQLVWRAIGQSDTSLKAFVHLYDARGPANGSPLWSQDDQYIQDGRVDTRLWASGSLLRDAYHLPLAGVPPGQYGLYVGMYDPASGERLTTEQGNDSVMVARINLQGPEPGNS